MGLGDKKGRGGKTGQTNVNEQLFLKIKSFEARVVIDGFVLPFEGTI